ncbi:MAG TPA: hypothetical protein VLL52_12090 [Anaerolineae bacterium]|nr:hypothetical protein [Anaerolineae bacterium]
MKKKVFSRYISLLIFISVLCNIFVWQPLVRYSRNGEWADLKSEQYNFMIEYPAHWILSTYGDRGSKGNQYARAYIRDGSSFGIYIYQHQMQNANLHDTVQWWKLEAYPLEKPIRWPHEFEERTVGENDYYALYHSYILGDYKLYIQTYFVAHNDNIYAISLKCNDNEIEQCHQEAFDRMLTSFRFLDEE